MQPTLDSKYGFEYLTASILFYRDITSPVMSGCEKRLIQFDFIKL